MSLSRCAICNSPHREEIERKAKFRSKPVNIIAWAKERGVAISYSSLSRHRENHMNPALVRPGAGSAGANGDRPSPSTELGLCEGNGHKGDGEVTLRETPAKKGRHKIAATNEAPARAEIVSAPISDEMVLDAVRDAVYGKLKEGALELEVGSAFKAIELKHKIAEESQSEKMLVEILNEIRGQELGKSAECGLRNAE